MGDSLASLQRSRWSHSGLLPRSGICRSPGRHVCPICAATAPISITHFRQVDNSHDITRVAANERNVPRLNSHISSRSNRDSHVGGDQRRRVIHAISDHCNALSRILQFLDVGGLPLRQDFGENNVNPKLSRNRFRDALAVASHHDDLNATLMQKPHGFRRLPVGQHRRWRIQPLPSYRRRDKLPIERGSLLAPLLDGEAREHGRHLFCLAEAEPHVFEINCQRPPLRQQGFTAGSRGLGTGQVRHKGRMKGTSLREALFTTVNAAAPKQPSFFPSSIDLRR
jgi:hypothetical protein